MTPDTTELQEITPETLQSAVKSSKVFILLLTNEVLTRPWCLLEIYTALENKIPVIPVRIERQRLNYSYSGAADFLSNLVGNVRDEELMHNEFGVGAWGPDDWAEIEAACVTGEKSQHPGQPLTLRVVQEMLSGNLPSLKAEEYKPNANPVILKAQVAVIVGKIEKALEGALDQSLSEKEHADREQMKVERVKSQQQKLEEELEEEMRDLQDNLRAFRHEGDALPRQLSRHNDKTAQMREENTELRRQIAAPESLNALTKSVPVMPHDPGTTAQVRLLVTAFFDWLAAGTVVEEKSHDAEGP